jgi:alkanesulfonate monooxygenase SsuD/methylene tetrahydromethanopterin reductase-like flavin-dependent oxidoreductase (luciferase family)
MQFGLFYKASEDPRHTHAERFAEMFALIVYGESLGFDVAWLAEIHCGGAFSLLSAPLMVVPAIVAPPIWAGVHTAESFAHLGSLGWPIYSETTTPPLPQLREGMALYRGHLQARGHTWRDDQMALMFPMHQGMFGDPSECIDRLQAARDEFGLCQIICWFDQGGRLQIEEVKRTMAQFANAVMPKV